MEEAGETTAQDMVDHMEEDQTRMVQALMMDMALVATITTITAEAMETRVVRTSIRIICDEID